MGAITCGNVGICGKICAITCGNVGIWNKICAITCGKCRKFGTRFAQLLAHIVTSLAQLLAENVGIWHKFGAITCGKCRNLAQDWRTLAKIKKNIN